MEQVNKITELEAPINKISKDMKLRLWALSRAKVPSAKDLFKELGLDKEPIFQSEIRALANILSQEHLRAKEAVYTKFSRFFKQEGFRTVHRLLGFRKAIGSGIGLGYIPLKERTDVSFVFRPFCRYIESNGIRMTSVNTNTPSTGYQNLKRPSKKPWRWDKAPILRVLFDSVAKESELTKLLIEKCGAMVYGWGAKRTIRARFS